jgi:hypothetical protein
MAKSKWESSFLCLFFGKFEVPKPGKPLCPLTLRLYLYYMVNSFL